MPRCPVTGHNGGTPAYEYFRRDAPKLQKRLAPPKPDSGGCLYALLQLSLMGFVAYLVLLALNSIFGFSTGLSEQAQQTFSSSTLEIIAAVVFLSLVVYLVERLRQAWDSHLIRKHFGSRQQFESGRVPPISMPSDWRSRYNKWIEMQYCQEHDVVWLLNHKKYVKPESRRSLYSYSSYRTEDLQ